MPDAIPMQPAMPPMSELQQARFALLQSQMQTLNAQMQAAALTQTNCELMAGELQRKMDALMAEVRADQVAAAAGVEVQRDAA